MIENVMYAGLGFLAATLLALLILPAVWGRAVRLTKKRIEAATPVTLSEFRADKDQLRAEFALSTRRLEMHVEALRKRLAEQLGDINRNKTDLSLIKSDRDEQLTIIRELEEREAEARRRILELEKEGADLAQRLRMRDRELEDRAQEVVNLRASQSMRYDPPAVEGLALVGEYDVDTAELAAALRLERQRAQFLDHQARGLIGKLEQSDKRAMEATAALAQLRQAMAKKGDSASARTAELADAEARIATAENRLNAALVETALIVEETHGKTNKLIAEKLSAEAEIESLKRKVLSVEGTILADWELERIEQTQLRERLNDIASHVSRLANGADPRESEAARSLSATVARYAEPTNPAAPGLPAAALGLGEAPAAGPMHPGVATAVGPASPIKPAPRKGGSLLDRIAALKDMRER